AARGDIAAPFVSRAWHTCPRGTGGGPRPMTDTAWAPRKDASPRPRRKRTAGDMVGRRAVIVAEPDPDDQRIVEADEPRVVIVLTGTGFSGGGGVERRRTAGSGVD